MLYQLSLYNPWKHFILKFPNGIPIRINFPVGIPMRILPHIYYLTQILDSLTIKKSGMRDINHVVLLKDYLPSW